MNKKSFLALILSMVLLSSVASADTLLNKYQSAKNKAIQADAQVTNALNASSQAKTNRISTLKSQKAAALAPISTQINAKKKEIKTATNSTTLLAVEKKVYLKKLNSELKVLNKKYNTTAAYYDKQIKAIK